MRTDRGGRFRRSALARVECRNGDGQRRFVIAAATDYRPPQSQSDAGPRVTPSGNPHMNDTTRPVKAGPSYTDEEALDFHPRGGRARSKSRRPSRWRRSATCRSPIRRASRCRSAPSPRIPTRAYDYTTRGNLVAVISNGTAILGLGDLGALASKPVMEGKAVLFKRFADVDSIDLEVDTEDVDEFINCGALSRPVLRRHQSRGHQGARLLHHRAAAARADGHPGLP